MKIAHDDNIKLQAKWKLKEFQTIDGWLSDVVQGFHLYNIFANNRFSKLLSIVTIGFLIVTLKLRNELQQQQLDFYETWAWSPAVVFRQS